IVRHIDPYAIDHEGNLLAVEAAHIDQTLIAAAAAVGAIHAGSQREGLVKRRLCDQTWYFAKPTLDEALSLAPGVNSSDGGSSRNERLIYVRGFDREQVPLMIDGVRVFMPYDNRLDFSDFVTPDISEIQIAKGYVSVLDGPGAIGGALNLVTKRPTKELEVEVGSSMTFARDGSYEGFSSYGSVGTRQKYWYMLVTGTIYDRKGWMLSEDYQPATPAGATASGQGAGWRDNSQKEDWRVSAKVGI